MLDTRVPRNLRSTEQTLTAHFRERFKSEILRGFAAVENMTWGSAREAWKAKHFRMASLLHNSFLVTILDEPFCLQTHSNIDVVVPGCVLRILGLLGPTILATRGSSRG